MEKSQTEEIREDLVKLKHAIIQSDNYVKYERDALKNMVIDIIKKVDEI